MLGRVSQQIVTGDAVVLDLRPARLPTRLLSDAIDIAICAALSFFGWRQVMDAVHGSSPVLQQSIDNIGYVLISFGYPIACETLSRGRTFGAWVMGLRAVRDDGGSIRFRHALMRWLGFWLADYAIWTGMLGGVVTMSLHPQCKRIGDLMAGTMMIRTRAPRAAEDLPEMDPALADWAARLELSRVTNDLWAAARYTMARRRAMREDYRKAMVHALAHQIAVRSSPPPPEGLGPEDFLVAVLAEHRRRSLRKVYARRPDLAPAELGA